MRGTKKFVRSLLGGLTDGRVAWPLARVLLLLAASLTLGQTAFAQGTETPVACETDNETAPQPGVDYDPRFVLITFSDQCGQPVPLAVDLAADEARQEQGLMNVAILPPDQGELFIFNNLAGGAQVQVGFWMEDTLIPLSIAFIGADGTVHEIDDMQAETTDIHTPTQPYLYAVEANLGWFAQHNIVPGSSVDLSAALALVSG